MENKNTARLDKMVLLPTPIAGDWKGPGRRDLTGSTLLACNQVAAQNKRVEIESSNRRRIK